MILFLLLTLLSLTSIPIFPHAAYATLQLDGIPISTTYKIERVVFQRELPPAPVSDDIRRTEAPATTTPTGGEVVNSTFHESFELRSYQVAIFRVEFEQVEQIEGLELGHNGQQQIRSTYNQLDQGEWTWINGNNHPSSYRHFLFLSFFSLPV